MILSYLYITKDFDQLEPVTLSFLLIRIVFILILNLNLQKFKISFLFILAIVCISLLIEFTYIVYLLIDSNNSSSAIIFLTFIAVGILGLIISHVFVFGMIIQHKIEHKMIFIYFTYAIICSLIIVVGSSIYYNFYIFNQGMTSFRYLVYGIMVHFIDYGYILIFVLKIQLERKIKLLDIEKLSIEEMKVIK